MKLLLTILLLLSSSILEAGQSYCKDSESWKEWDKLVIRYPHDQDIQMLHAVRIGLCKKIQDKTITLEKATRIFNELHNRVYLKSDRAQKQQEENKRL